MAQDDDPREGTTQRALKRGDGNSNSKASKQPAQNHNVISSLGTTSTASSFDWAAAYRSGHRQYGWRPLSDMLPAPRRREGHVRCRARGRRAKTVRSKVLREMKEAAVGRYPNRAGEEEAMKNNLTARRLVDSTSSPTGMMPNSMDTNEEEFLTCARYGLMLAEQNADDAIRANLLKLVRAWLAAANEIEKAASNVLAEISARP